MDEEEGEMNLGKGQESVMIETEGQIEEGTTLILIPLNIQVGFSTARANRASPGTGTRTWTAAGWAALSILFDASSLSLISASIGIERNTQ